MPGNLLSAAGGIGAYGPLKITGEEMFVAFKVDDSIWEKEFEKEFEA